MNRIHKLEFNVAPHRLFCAEERDISTWTRNDLMPLVDTLLEQELSSTLTRDWQTDDEVPSVIYIHHIQLRIEADNPLDFKRKFVDSLQQELRAAIRYAFLCNKQRRAEFSEKRVKAAINNASNNSFIAVLQSLFARPESGSFDADTFKVLQVHWQLWSKEQAPQLRAELFRHLRNRGNRSLVAERFSTVVQNDLITLLEPLHAVYILSFINVLEDTSQKPLAALSPRESKAPNNKKQQSDTAALLLTEEFSVHRVLDAVARPCLVEFSLAYITCERGSRFNRKMYMRSVVRQLAHHNNLSVQVLTHTLQTIIPLAEMPLNLKADFLDILQPEQYASTLDGSEQHAPILVTAEPDRGEVSYLHYEKNSSSNELETHRVAKALQRSLQSFGSDLRLPQELHKQISYLLRHDRARLVKILRSFSRDQGGMALATQLGALPDPLRRELCSTLNRSLYQKLENIFPLIETLWMESRIALRSHPGEFGSMITGFFLNPKATDNTRECLLNFLEYYIRTLALQSKQAPQIVQQELQILLDRKSYPRYLCWDIKSTLNRMQVDYDALECSKNNPSVETDNYALNKELYTPFIHAIQRGVWDLDQSTWKRLQCLNIPYLRSLTRLLLQDLRYRQTLVVNIPEAIQCDLVTVMEPGSHQSILEVWRGAGHIKRLMLTENKSQLNLPQKNSQNDNAQNVYAAIREFTFTYLAVERGSEFNQRSYARSLLRQLSAHYNLNYQALLVSFQQHLSRSRIPTALRKQWLAISGCEIRLNEEYIYNEDDVNVRHWQRQSLSAVAGARAYVELLQLLTVQDDPPQQRISGLIQFLGEQHRFYFQRLADLINEQRIPRNQLYQRLSVSTFAHLFEQLFMLTGSNRSRFTLLRKSLQSALAECTDKRSFYLQIILDVLQGKLIDLERAQHNSGSGIEKFTQQPVKDLWEQPRNSSSSALEVCDFCLPLSNKSLSDKAINSSDKEKNSNGVEELSQSKLSSYGIDGKPIAKLAESLSTAMKLVVRGEAWLWDQCYTFSETKVQLFYPVAQVLRLLLSNCERRLLVGEQEWSSRLLSHNRMSEQQWLATIFHHLASQLLVSGGASTDRFVQLVLQTVFKYWQLNKQHFDMQGFSRLCVKQLYSGRYSPHKIFNSELQNILQSLTASDVGMEIDNAPVLNMAPVSNKQSVTKLPRPEYPIPQSSFSVQTEGIQNVAAAGIVLLAPYVGVLFERMNLLDHNNLKKNSSGKALQLLHFLCMGTLAQHNFESSLWCFFKLLCGLAPDSLVEPETLYTGEQTLCTHLLTAVIQHWRVLGSTSIEGLQETFLQRGGTLRKDEEKGWSLMVDTHALDVLLDRLPWSFSVIKYPFMKEAVHVQWRK